MTGAGPDAGACVGAGVTLGLLAGGQASRLGGRDKAWLLRDGVPQVLRWHALFGPRTLATVVSANRAFDRYRDAGLQAVADCADEACQGPLAGLQALAGVCTTAWMLTLPVDLECIAPDALDVLRSNATADGACARDLDGLQPLVALWRVDALRWGLDDARRSGVSAVHRLQARLAMSTVDFAPQRFGNLNTPADLERAGVEHRS